MPRLLWFSPCPLHDTSSGAALQSRIILHKLQQRSVQITALGGCSSIILRERPC